MPRLLALLLFVTASTLAEPARNSPSGRAVNVNGTVLIHDRKLSVGDAVFAGDKVTTKAASSVKLLMADRTILDIAESSTLVIKDYPSARDFNRNADIQLEDGAVRSSVSKTGRKTKFYIRTKSSVLAVRGTEFVTTSRDEGSLRREQVTVLEGSVDVTPQASGFSPTQLGAGRQWTVEGTLSDNRFQPLGTGPRVASLSTVDMSQIVERARSEEKTFVQSVAVSDEPGSGKQTVASAAQALARGREVQSETGIRVRDANSANGQGVAGREVPGFSGLPGTNYPGALRVPGASRVPIEVIVLYQR